MIESDDAERDLIVREWRQLQRDIEASEGTKAHRRIQALGRGCDIVGGTYADLAKAFAFYESPQGLDLWEVSRRAELSTAVREVERALHNYLASVFSLADHTRNMMRDAYADADTTRTAYHERVKTDFSDPLPRFIHSLRNYILHYRLPAPTASLRPPQGGVFLLLKTSELQQFGRWSKEASNFLKVSGDEINLKTVVLDYNVIAATFYGWLIQLLDERHADEMAATNRLIDSLREMHGPDGLRRASS